MKYYIIGWTVLVVTYLSMMAILILTPPTYLGLNVQIAIFLFIIGSFAPKLGRDMDLKLNKANKASRRKE